MANSCPVCAGDEIVLFLQGIFDSETTAVLECRRCGVQFLEPMMSDAEAATYYQDYYRKQESRHFARMGLADIQARAIRHYEQYRDIYTGILGPSRRILEIGSGSGGFLRFARNASPQAEIVALERDPVNRQFIGESCPGIECVEHLTQLAGRSFDAIVAFGVFEHLPDGAGFLREVFPLLRPGGTLALNVPNKAHALVYDYDLAEFRKFTYMKQHCLTYTEQAFRYLAGQTGYGVERFHYLQVWGLDNHLSWLRYRQPRDFSDLTRLLSRETLEAYNCDLIAAKKTDLMMAVLIREGGKQT